MLKTGYKFLFMGLLIMVWGSIAVAAKREKAAISGPIPVVLAPVVKMGYAKVTQTIGSITDPMMATLSAADSGHVTEIRFKNGAQVKKGMLLIQLDDSLEKAELENAKAKAVASKEKYQRSVELSQDKVAGLGVSPLAEQDLADIKSIYLQDKASVAQAQAVLSKRSVIAPFSGKIGAISVSVGDYVTSGQGLVTLVNYQDLQVSFRIPQDEINQLHIGQEIAFSSSLFSEKKMSAVVTFMAPAVDAANRTLACLATIKKTTEELRPGLFVQVDLSEKSKPETLQIPEQALVPAYPSYIVYRVVDNKALKTPVLIGQRIRGQVVVQKGLKFGEQVVIAGQSNLSNGQAVTIVAP